MIDFDKTINRKLAQFEESIMRSAQERCMEIQRETEEYKEQELKKYKDDLSQNSKGSLVAGVSDLRTNSVKSLSQKKIEYKRSLFLKRESYINDIFEKSRKNLIDFCKSEQYPDYLKNIILKACSDIPPGPLSIKLNERDIKSGSVIIEECGRECSIYHSHDILIGGALIINESASLIYDFTLDTKLAEQKMEFYSFSDFIIDF